MKTAAEWRSEIVDYECSHFDGSYDKLILAIQLDAMKEGMRRAKQICFDVQTTRMFSKHKVDGALDCQLEIQQAAEQLTEKDL